MNQSQRITKNLFAGGLSTALGGVLQLAAIVIIARGVKVSDFGAYSLMLSFAFVLERMADSGLNSILMRDMAVAPERVSELLGGALTLTVPYILAASLVMVAIIPFFHFDLRFSILTAIMGFARLEHVFIGCYGAVLLSREDYELHAIGFVLHKLVLLALVLAALMLGTGLDGVVIAHALSIIPPWILFHWLVVTRYARPKLKFDLKLWKYLIRESIPLGGTSVLRLIAEQADVMVLGAIAGTVAAGLFSGPSRMANGLRYFPQALVIALFPMYSRKAADSSSQGDLSVAYQRGVKAFVVMGFPLALVFLARPEVLTVSLLGAKYQPAIPAMRLMGVTVWLIFASAPYLLLMTALGLQRFLFVSTAAALALRLALDVALVPRMGFLGPCVAMNVSEGLLLAAWVVCMWRAGYPLSLFEMLWRPCVATALMWALLRVIGTHSLAVLAPVFVVAFALYLGILYLLGAFSEAEIAQFREGMRFVRPFIEQWTGRTTHPRSEVL